MTMTSLWPVVIAYAAFVMAMVSPGPDFFMILRNTLGHSLRAGIFSAAGIAIGLSVHIAYTFAGIGLLISKSIMLFNIVKWVGAAYLIYIGVSALRSKGIDVKVLAIKKSEAGKSDGRAFLSGFVTEVTNPKATLFFVSLFSQMVGPSTPPALQVALALACMITAFVWFALVALVMGVGPVREAYRRASKWIDRTLGGFFIALGAKLAFIRQR